MCRSQLYFMDACRRYKTLELETEDFVISGLTSSTEHHVCVGPPYPCTPRGGTDGLDGCWLISGPHYSTAVPTLGNPLVCSKLLASLQSVPEGDITFSSKLLQQIQLWKMTQAASGTALGFITYTAVNCKELSGSMAEAFSQEPSWKQGHCKHN